MAVAGGPNLSENGLVFYYDTDNGKSYKGEPTTNLIGNFVSHYNNEEYWVRPTNFYQLEATAPYVVDPTAPGGAYVHATGNTSDTNAQIFWSAGNSICNEYGQQVSVSAWLRGSGEVRLIAYDDTTGYKSSPAITLTQEWTYYEYSTTFGSGGAQNNHWVGVREITNGEYVQVAKMQWERKPHATQYVKGTRSATQSLYDFISDSALDVSNVSFDSNADITFDGTDDNLQINPFNLDVSSGLSYEVVYSANSTYNTWGTYHYLLRFVGTTHYGLLHEGDSRGWRFDVPTSAGARTGVTTNNPNATAGAGYYHVAVSFDPVTGGKGYLNGVEIGSWAGGYTPFTPSSLLIGAETIGTRFWDGDIPLVKIYNRALTAEEVQNNFNGIRSRFGI